MIKSKAKSKRKFNIPSWLYKFYAFLMVSILVAALCLNSIENKTEGLLWAVFLIGFTPLLRHLFPNSPSFLIFQKRLKALIRILDEVEQTDK